MTKTTHTPGPWEYLNAATPDNTGGYDCAIVDQAGRIIAETFQNVGYDVETGQIRRNGGNGVAYDERPVEANARLIAASPTIYDYVIKKSKEGCEEAISMLSSLGLTN